MKSQKLFVTTSVVTVAAACLFFSASCSKDQQKTEPAPAAEAKTQQKAAPAAKAKVQQKAAPAAKAKAQPKAAPAAQAKAQPKAAPAPAAKAESKTPPKAKTLNDIFAFLPDVLATIGNKKITKAEFLKQLGNVPVEYIAQLQPEMIKAQSKQMISAMVEAELLLALAEKAGIKPSKELAMSMIDQQIKAMPANQRDMIEQQLKLQNKTLKDVKEEAVKDPNTLRLSAIQKYVESKIRPTIKITDADIEKYYRENQDMFRVPEKIRVSHILISTMDDPNAQQKPDAAAKAKKDQEAKAKAEKLLAQIKQGADFGALAEKESACGSKRNKGDLGEITRGRMVPEFEKAAFALNKPGELSPIVKTQFGYHIIKLTSKTPASVTPLAKVKPAIRKNLENNQIAKTVKDQIDAAKKTMNVKIAEIK